MRWLFPRQHSVAFFVLCKGTIHDAGSSSISPDPRHSGVATSVFVLVAPAELPDETIIATLTRGVATGRRKCAWVLARYPSTILLRRPNPVSAPPPLLGAVLPCLSGRRSCRRRGFDKELVSEESRPERARTGLRGGPPAFWRW